MQLRRLLWLMSAPGGGRTILFMSFDQPQRQMGSLRTSRVGLRMACLEVSCLGRCCPSARARRSATGVAARFAPFERALSAGTVIEVVVRPAVAAIGKHARFVIREGAATARVDSCVVPPASRPAKCPRR